MKIKKLVEDFLTITFVITSANAVKQDEIQPIMTKKK